MNQLSGFVVLITLMVLVSPAQSGPTKTTDQQPVMQSGQQSDQVVQNNDAAGAASQPNLDPDEDTLQFREEINKSQGGSPDAPPADQNSAGE